jgi:hypothetical protein
MVALIKSEKQIRKGDEVEADRVEYLLESSLKKKIV